MSPETRARPHPPGIATYLRKRAVLEPWRITGSPGQLFRAAVVIPALAEYANLRHTLQTLASNPPELLAQTLILVVVNQRCDASPAERADNLATLGALTHWKRDLGLEHLHWVDAASSGIELPAKQGVGLARKIGLDLALTRLDFSAGDPLLICLDADTLVQPDYLGAITTHFAVCNAGGAAIPFCHRPAGDRPGQAAIDRYELFLRVYVLGMELAGSPYAFHTVGSAMACRASAYTASGGMNRRQAGEDFYFLQQLHKTSAVAALSGTIVHPSPRSSHRVPFGTGRAVGDMLAPEGGELLFYQPQLFGIVGQWLMCVAEHGGADGYRLLERAGEISPHLQTYLEAAGFREAWDNLIRNNRDDQRLMGSFHGWFDAFRTMKLMHHLTDCAYPRIPAEKAVPALLARAGLAGHADLGGLIECMRGLQGVRVWQEKGNT
jgi:hypothetical protein